MNFRTLGPPIFSTLEGQAQSISRFEQSDEPMAYIVCDFLDYDFQDDDYWSPVPANAKAVDIVEKFLPSHPNYELIRYKRHATSPQMAAELYAEMWYTDYGWPDDLDLIVTDPDGKEWRCKVSVETKFIFTAACEEFGIDSDTDEVEDQ